MGKNRIYFSSADLARTTFASSPDPLWEIVLSLHILQGERPSAYPEWCQMMAKVKDGAYFSRLVRSLLFPLDPAAAYFPDFLTPMEGLLGFEAGLDAILSTPQARVRRELASLSPSPSGKAWIAQVADGDSRTWRLLENALRTYYDRAIVPHWPTISNVVRAEQMLRASLDRDYGIQHALASLQPVATWNPPVLEYSGPRNRDIYLNGRGLVLIPSYFCWHHPIALADDELPPVLVYPTSRLVRIIHPSAQDAGPLKELLGESRTILLRAAIEPRTTTELAGQAFLSISTASTHAKILRQAGLITSQRDGMAVIHTITSLGLALLREGSA